MNKKYFFFDIDGTLTDNATKEVVPSAAEAITKLQEAGHFVSVATGRANYKAEPFRAKYNFPNMVCNGGHGIFYDGKLIENRPIDYEKSLAIYKEAKSLGFDVLVALDDSKKVYVDNLDFYAKNGPRKEPTTYVIDEDFDPADYDAIYKLYVGVTSENEDKLTLKDTVGHLRIEEKYLMFQADVKLEGIMRMLEYAGGQPENVIVFGDDYNDLVMFVDPFYKVAMGNACEELKEKADYVAAKNTEDGIYKACLEHGWFEKCE